MGTGFSADTPIRVAHLGITSVISLVDDLLLEQLRKFYCGKFSLPYAEIPKNADDGRAKRITAYLNTVNEIVRIKFDAIRKESFTPETEKTKYFELLADDIYLKHQYIKFLNMPEGAEKRALGQELTEKMTPGSIEINIMVKLDRANNDSKGNPLPDEYNDAKAALRGYAMSSLKSGIVLSAGINQRLFNYMTGFRDFYRDERGEINKKIILKVSDFRSSIIQGKFLAKKGLEVYEFRIESGLNCGGHVFPANGTLLPVILQELREHRGRLAGDFRPFIMRYYKKMGWDYPESAFEALPLLTVQGGIGTNGEMRRLLENFGMDRTGWGTPFLLVPEATCVDKTTLELLSRAGEEDLYISNVSPFGVQFSNVHGSGADIWRKNRIKEGRPGSPCRKAFLRLNTEFTEKPICLASSLYEKKKLEEIERLEASGEEKEQMIAKVLCKECICDQLGNSCLIALGIAEEKDAPQCICPGANIAWFNRIYSLKEMVDHIYGRGPSLVPPERPHMFAKEIELYMDYFESEVKEHCRTPEELKTLMEFKDNFKKSIDFCMEIAGMEPYPGENLTSISLTVDKQRSRFTSICEALEKKSSDISDQN